MRTLILATAFLVCLGVAMGSGAAFGCDSEEYTVSVDAVAPANGSTLPKDSNVLQDSYHYVAVTRHSSENPTGYQYEVKNWNDVHPDSVTETGSITFGQEEYGTKSITWYHLFLYFYDGDKPDGTYHVWAKSQISSTSVQDSNTFYIDN